MIPAPVGTGADYTRMGLTFQISRAYWDTVRSLEQWPDWAMFTADARSQPGRS